MTSRYNKLKGRIFIEPKYLDWDIVRETRATVAIRTLLQVGGWDRLIFI